MALEINWNAEYNGVEIHTDKDHFIVDAGPSRAMSYVDAMRLFKGTAYTLPTKEQLKVIGRNIGKINLQLRANGGYRIYQEWHSTKDSDGTYVSTVNTGYGAVYCGSIHAPFHARAVIDLNAKIKINKQ
uniref:hypothetical protein n=1 Tax=Alistipes sp. TaxID=1872444 RepID=UPI004055B612